MNVEIIAPIRLFLDLILQRIQHSCAPEGSTRLANLDKDKDASLQLG